MVYLIKKINIILVTTILLAISGCVSQRDLEYLQTKDKNVLAFKDADLADYKLKPNDELYITVTSLDEVNTNVFTNAGNSQNMNIGSLQPYGASLMSYSINKEGYLLLPVIGIIFVKDKTLTQVSTLIKDSLLNILSQPQVSVKLVNRYISVLGQVRNPGHFPYAQEKLILTRNENGKNVIVRIDLTKPEILETNFYYLRPNDMIYIKPMRKRLWGMEQFPYALILSTITTGLLLYNVIK